jgi:uncharacterized protein with GYD domain
MASYILLGNLTDQGVRTVKDSTKRAEAFKELARSKCATVKEIFWTLGQYDIVAVVDAPDDTVITTLGLRLANAGNARTQTLRAFSQAEMSAILSKVA